MSDPLNRYTQQNRRAWNEIAAVRAQTFPPAEFYAQGGSSLHERVVQAAGHFAGKTVLHLQCSTGEETLSWAVLGARATGVDISEEQVALARQKAQSAGLDVCFCAADIYHLPAGVQSGEFDYVYTGGGALVWLPDIWQWARIVFDCLKPGGRLILYEIHPVMSCLWYEGDRLVVDSDYFGRHRPMEVSGWYHFRGGEQAREIKYEFSWPLGDVVTAVAQAGLLIERLEEFPGGPSAPLADFPQAAFLPADFLLVAIRP